MGIRSRIYKYILGKRVANQIGQSEEIYELKFRIENLENRLIDFHRNRWDAIDNLADYLVVAELEGDYCEFGVAQGKTFAYAANKLSVLDMRFFAFDSFEGLPKPHGFNRIGGYTGGYHEKEFSYSEEEFFVYLKSKGVDSNRVNAIKGWFDVTLIPQTSTVHKLTSIAAAWVDCDFYESTVPVLNFLTDKLVEGSVILFDDWHAFRNLPEYGAQKACKEWLIANPNITLLPLFSFGSHGEAFTMGS